MVEIGVHQGKLGLTGKVSLIYERCDYGESLLRGFNTMMDDPTFSYPRFFTTIAPMGWENCIPLQPADMVAYELFRDTKRRALSRDMNQSLLALVQMPTFQLISKLIKKEHLIKLREMHERQIKK